MYSLVCAGWSAWKRWLVPHRWRSRDSAWWSSQNYRSQEEYLQVIARWVHCCWEAGRRVQKVLLCEPNLGLWCASALGLHACTPCRLVALHTLPCPVSAASNSEYHLRIRLYYCMQPCIYTGNVFSLDWVANMVTQQCDTTWCWEVLGHSAQWLMGLEDEPASSPPSNPVFVIWPPFSPKLVWCTLMFNLRLTRQALLCFW